MATIGYMLILVMMTDTTTHNNIIEIIPIIYFCLYRVTLFIVMIVCGLELNIYKLQRICSTLIKFILSLLILQLIIFGIYTPFWTNYYEFNKIFYYK